MLAAASAGYETQGAQIEVSMGWETAADFDLRLPGSPVPELSAAELILPVVLIMVCAVLCAGKLSATLSLEDRRNRKANQNALDTME